MTCMCNFCERHRDWVADSIPESIIDLVEHLESDVQYYEIILNGHWPSGKLLLENALKLYEVDHKTQND